MRTLTAGNIAKAGTRLGTEPIIVIKVSWIGGDRYYSDKSFTLGSLNIEGKIYDFSAIQGQLNDKSFGQVQSASVTLSDIDGTLKDLFDNTVVEQRPVIVYHYYEGLTESDLTPVLNGKLVSPINWNEGDRKFSFEINSEIDSKDLCLEIHEGSPDFPAQEDEGKTLPMCFGTPLRVPGVEVQLGKTGELLSAITSWTTWYRDEDPDTRKVTYKSTRFHVSNFESYFNQSLLLEIDDSLYLGKFDNPADLTEFNCSGLGGFNDGYPVSIGIAGRDENDIAYANNSMFWVQSSDEDLTGRVLLIHYDITYMYVEYSADGVIRQDRIGEEAYGNIKDADTGGALAATRKATTETFVARVTSHDLMAGKVYLSRQCVDRYNQVVLLSNKTDDVEHTSQIKNVKGKAEYDWSMLPSDGESLTWTISPGARVRIYNMGSVFVVNSVPSTMIHEVVAKRKGEYVAVPMRYYTKYLDYPAIVDPDHDPVITEHLTVIKMNRPLSKRDEEWNDDQIYVSLTSSVGPNTATQVIDWIISNRTTGLIKDSTTFTAVGTDIANYPSHFAVLSQVDSIEALKNFAWQARVGVYFDAGVAYLHYLSKEPIASVYTANITKIKFKSMTVSKTPTDDIITKTIGFWNRTYAEEDKKKVVLHLNEDIYTKKDVEIDFSIYNIESLVRKSATFWSNRLSNAWVTTNISTFLTSLAIQMWDTVTVDCAYINKGVALFGSVTGINFDTALHQITLDVWLPIKQGKGDAYLNDSSDVMPPNPAEGLSEIDYVIFGDVPRTKKHAIFKKRGESIIKDAPSSAEPIEPDTPRDGEFEILEVFDNYLRCKLLSYDSQSANGVIHNNVQNESIFMFVAKKSDGAVGSMRVMDWNGKTFNTGPNGTPAYYTKTSSFERIVDGVDEDGNSRTDWEKVNPPYAIAGSKVTLRAIFCPKGTGVATATAGKMYWLEVSERAWAFYRTS